MGIVKQGSGRRRKAAMSLLHVALHVFLFALPRTALPAPLNLPLPAVDPLEASSRARTTVSRIDDILFRELPSYWSLPVLAQTVAETDSVRAQTLDETDRGPSPLKTVLIAALTAAVISAASILIHLHLVKRTRQVWNEHHKVTSALKQTAETARQLRGFSQDVEGLRRAGRRLATELWQLQEHPNPQTFHKCMDAAGELRVHHNTLWEEWAAMRTGSTSGGGEDGRLWKALNKEDRNRLWALIDDVHASTVAVEGCIDQLRRTAEEDLNNPAADDLNASARRWLEQLMPKLDLLFSHVVRNSVFLEHLPQENG